MPGLAWQKIKTRAEQDQDQDLNLNLNLKIGAVPVGAAGAVRQPRRRWIIHLTFHRPTAFAAVVTSDVSYKFRVGPGFCAFTQSLVVRLQLCLRDILGDQSKAGSGPEDWRCTCGSCWSCATAAKAVDQTPHLSLTHPVRCRRNLRRLLQLLSRTGILRTYTIPCRRAPTALFARYLGRSRQSGIRT